MTESAPTPSKNSGSFASFLASFTGSANDATDEWDLSALADDVATISYEQALQAHRRPRVSENATEELRESFTQPAPDPSGSEQTGPGSKKRKTASITLRLTAAEQAQLQERAAAAHISVSAYIRSCIFEAENLRAQVKEALKQIRATASGEPKSAEEPNSTPGHGRFYFFPRWSRRQTARS
jgi:hypothetical protein